MSEFPASNLLPVSSPQMKIITSSAPINLFMAGVGSGKTYLGGLLSARFIKAMPGIRGFIGANTYEQLTTSTLFRVREFWKALRWREGVHYVVGKQPPAHFKTDGHSFDSYNSIISFVNGGVIFKGSLENAKAHEGKEFGWAILDETKDSKEEDVKEVILNRLRQPGMTLFGEERNPLYIVTSPAKVEWINKWFNLEQYEKKIKDLIYSETEFFSEMTAPDKFSVISSTYHNERNLPKNFIEIRKENLTKEQFNRLIYGDPFMRTGGEFYSGYDRSVHLVPGRFIPGLALHISFDQNVIPYITMTIWQIRRENGVFIARAIDEICLENPRNTTEKLCDTFIAKYEQELSSGIGLFYYGDASGKARDTRGRENDYDIVERVLKPHLHNTSRRIPRVNPPVIRRKDFINSAFEGKQPFRIEIWEGCKELRGDLEYLKEGADGKKLKKEIKDEKTGAKYEEHGHTSDSMDYFLTEAFRDEFESYGAY